MISILKKINLNVLALPIFFGVILGYFAYQVHAINGLSDNTIRSDGTGYYAYLPAIFIYNDLQFDFLDNKALVNDDGASRVKLDNGKIVNKYACGLALLQLPFFLIAYLLSFLFGQPIDGYSHFFQYLFLLGNTVYFTLGLLFLNKILRLYRVQLWVTFLILLLFTAGNSVLHYTTYDAYLSHAFSLSLMTSLVYYILRFNAEPKIKYALLIGLLFGLIVLIRPFNLIAIICLPILFNQRKHLAQFIRSILPYTFYILVPFIITVSIQFILWKLQTGDFLVYSYGNEKFIWGTHDPLFALFSYRRGFFIYNPIWAAAIVYYLFHFTKIKFSLFSIFVVFGILVFLLSTWHAKLYGMSLGYRPLLEYQIFLLFPFLHLYQQKKINIRRTGLVLPLISVFCVWYSITLVIQYQQNILRWEGPNQSEYWEIFGKTDARYNYHFFYPEQLIKTEYNRVEIPFDEEKVFTDAGITIYPDSFTKDPIKGIGFYSRISISNPKFATGIFDFYSGEKQLHWKHKLISKDIKVDDKFAPFYIDEFIKDSSVNKIVLKFINIREAQFNGTRKGKLILFTEPIQLEQQDSSSALF